MTLTMSKSIAAGLRLRAAPCGMCVVRREGFVSVLCTRLLRCSMSPYLITNNIFPEVLRFLRGRASPVKHTCALMVRLFQRRTPRPKNIALPEDCFTVVCEFVPSLAMLRGHNHGPIRVDWLEGELLGGFLTVWVKGCWRRWRRWRRRPPRLLLHLFQCANRRGKLSSELRPRARRVPVGGRSSFGGRRRHSVALQSVKQRQGI